MQTPTRPRPRFHTTTRLHPSQIGTTVVVDDDVAHHAVRVLRLERGHAITLFDGFGGEYAATLVETSKKCVTVTIDRFDDVERESPLHMTLVQAVIAADAMDYAIRKAVELGVTAIAPVSCARSQASGEGERAAKRLAHWQAIAVAACEQCGRNRVPSIAAVQPFAAWLREAVSQRVAIAAPGATLSLREVVDGGVPSSIVIGPEGGFTDDERAAAIAAGAVPFALGPRVLRAETAGVAALAMLAALAGDAR